MKASTQQNLLRRKRRIEKRLARRLDRRRDTPVFSAANIHYELADRARGLSGGGIGAMHLLARHVGLIEAIDANIHVLKVHKPYHESDHVLNIAYNILDGGTCLEDIELRRTNEVSLDALGAERIPDPTTAGDFCRRFDSDASILALMETINQVRLGVWREQPAEFFEQAIIEADGAMAPTDGQCKQGMNINHKGQWGYHPLLVSLANTKEPLYLVNRPGNRPSHEQADEYLDKAIALCRRGGFEQMLLRGDTDFEQTWKLDGWDDAGDVTFIFGADANVGLVRRAESLSKHGFRGWRRLKRAPKYEVKTQERAKPENVKERIVREKQFKNLVLAWEDVAEFEYQPVKCKHSYRMIALRKKIDIYRGQQRLFEQYRYFFYITNDRQRSAEQIVFAANDRCDQENLIAQLKSGVQSMNNPLDNLHSNWAYMVMSSLAWTLKAWCGLLLPMAPGRWQARHQNQRQTILKMEFKTFLNHLMRLPCQIIRTGRRLVYRLLSWNPWVGPLLRLVEAMRLPMRC